MIDRPRIALALGAAAVLIFALVFVVRPDKRPGPDQSVNNGETSSSDKNESTARDSPPSGAEHRWTPVSSQALKNTAKSIALTLQVSHSSVEVLGALRRSIPFRFETMRAGVYRIVARDSKNRELSVPIELPGLLPQSQAALADENGELTLGDEVFSLKVPVIVVVPDMPTPFTIRVVNRDGEAMGSAEVAEVKDKKFP